MIEDLALVALGGAIGAALRVLARSVVIARVHGTWRATLAVNLAGSVVIGLLAAPLADAPHWRVLLVPGVLGGFTTFSGFALDVVIAVDERRWGRAATIVAVTMVACPLACLVALRGIAG
jgi:CrcB protein